MIKEEREMKMFLMNISYFIFESLFAPKFVASLPPPFLRLSTAICKKEKLVFGPCNYVELSQTRILYFVECITHSEDEDEEMMHSIQILQWCLDVLMFLFQG